MTFTDIYVCWLIITFKDNAVSIRVDRICNESLVLVLLHKERDMATRTKKFILIKALKCLLTLTKLSLVRYKFKWETCEQDDYAAPLTKCLPWKPFFCFIYVIQTLLTDLVTHRTPSKFQMGNMKARWLCCTRLKISTLKIIILLLLWKFRPFLLLSKVGLILRLAQVWMGNIKMIVLRHVSNVFPENQYMPCVLTADTSLHVSNRWD